MFLEYSSMVGHIMLWQIMFLYKMSVILFGLTHKNLGCSKLCLPGGIMLLILCGIKMKQTVWTSQRGGWGWTKKKWLSRNILMTGFVLCLGWGGWRKRCRGKIFTPWEGMLLENFDGVCGFPELIPYILDQNTWIWFSLFCKRAEPLFLLKDILQKKYFIYISNSSSVSRENNAFVCHSKKISPLFWKV